MLENISIAFIGWNPFQLRHVSQLMRAIPSARFIIEEKNNNTDIFDDNLLEEFNGRIQRIPKDEVINLDGNVDVLICQTPFYQIAYFKITKIVMLQYGYAKEPHNYGTWRSLADLNLTYGQYATDKIQPYSPTASIGNPNFDKFSDNNYKSLIVEKFKTLVDPSRPTILYAPTWGDLSSLPIYKDAISNLANEYNVLVKLHHNTSILNKENLDLPFTNCLVFYENTDMLELLIICDVFISDYSGAIFDALYFSKPIFLLEIPDIFKSNKIDKYSLEYVRRSNIGLRVRSPEKLPQMLKEVRSESTTFLEGQRTLREQLFNQSNDTATRFKSEVYRLMKGDYQLNQSQQYIRATVKENLILRQENSRLKKQPFIKKMLNKLFSK